MPQEFPNGFTWPTHGTVSTRPFVRQKLRSKIQEIQHFTCVQLYTAFLSCSYSFWVILTITKYWDTSDHSPISFSALCRQVYRTTSRLGFSPRNTNPQRKRCFGKFPRFKAVQKCQQLLRWVGNKKITPITSLQFIVDFLQHSFSIHSLCGEKGITRKYCISDFDAR